jgi:hypothetical protein
VSDNFSIDTVFADFMRNMGGTPQDSGGNVTFTGSTRFCGPL